MKIQEVINHGSFPDDQINRQYLDSLVKDSVVITQVRKHISLNKADNKYLLVKNGTDLLGMVVLSTPTTINKITYETLAVIYVLPEYRKTSATHWLIFAVKEELTRPLLVDGAVFKDGGELIKATLKHQSIQASILDKTTGRVEPITDLVNDPNKAYVFEQTGIGYSKDFFGNGEPIWLTVFEDVDTI